MTTAASLPADVTETTDPAADAAAGSADGTAQNAGETPAADATSTPEPAPEAPTEVLEASDDFVEGVGERSETAGAFLSTLREWAIETDTFRFSLLDALLIIAVILLVLTGAWLATRLVRAALKRATRLDGSQTVLAEKLTTMAIWGAAFFIGIDLLGIDLTALAFFGGAFGLAIGFGLQKTFGNLISGILLLLDKSIKPGDVITVTDGSGNESFGQIRKIGIRAISVITRDQTEYLIPNENLMINQVVNWSYSSRDVRVRAPVGVSYNSDIPLVKELLYQAVADTNRILTSPRPRVNIMEFGDNSVNFEIRFWIRDPEEGLANIRSDVYDRVWELFKQNDVEIPFPQQDIHLRSSKELDRLIDLLSDQKAKAAK
ncbi:mechanosensitive ion channel family protein [Erythrobacter sp. MTPC3]|uniref:mechanosensitive ion channel family protein n=1 Tax=Erythrobacter sp. MTPC3 TaxID=3056564 RepID=UPI0036F3068F